MSEQRRIVLDTNCLIAALSRHSEYYPVWSDFQAGKYTLCVSNEILEEYQEIIEQKTSSIVAQNVINLLLKSRNVWSRLLCRLEGLPPLSPLRTVRATFTAYGSSYY